MKVKSESEVVQSCLTRSNPMDVRLPGSSIHGIFQARVLEWGAIAFSENLSSLQKLEKGSLWAFALYSNYNSIHCVACSINVDFCIN